MGKKINSKKDLLEFCRAHDELAHTREMHAKKSDASNILTDIYDQQLRAIESEITDKVKHWLGCIKKT